MRCGGAAYLWTYAGRSKPVRLFLILFGRLVWSEGLPLGYFDSGSRQPDLG